VSGKHKPEEVLRAAADGDVGCVVLDAVGELERGRGADGGERLARVTPGIEAETREAIRTGQAGSKFGMSPEDARAISDSVAGVHVHVGSQLLSTDAAYETVAWLNDFLDWSPQVVDLGGGLGVPTHPAENAPTIAEFVAALIEGLEVDARVILEPGRSLVGRAGVTLYRVGSVKRSADRTWVAIDGGMSDNPRPQLYGARYTAVLANRADSDPSGTFGVAGKHCESGDVLIEDIELPEPRRADVLAVPATGAYTLAMGSNYNALPRPAAVLVSGGEARLIRRRETVEELLRLEAG